MPVPSLFGPAFFRVGAAVPAAIFVEGPPSPALASSPYASRPEGRVLRAGSCRVPNIGRDGTAPTSYDVERSLDILLLPVGQAVSAAFPCSPHLAVQTFPHDHRNADLQNQSRAPGRISQDIGVESLARAPKDRNENSRTVSIGRKRRYLFLDGAPFRTRRAVNECGTNSTRGGFGRMNSSRN